MLVEMRTYTILPGKVPAFLEIYEREGLDIITRYARLVGCWTKDSGTLNSVVFCWAYDDYAHRVAQRSKLGADADWLAFTPRILPYLVHQESVFLAPAAFCPVL
ncbi:NIPSNAP family protein [Paraburkholderia silvatlantica]|uniref:NIPSNAP family protein n=1 Tax=Paraburkholderia silvatlantica TaxID=321895 RepID=UPI00106018B6|nr:NIPSNAP family protein [Paraburkholderia silvatlantica]TDQ89505.1 NIPSNAP protein [Paraburkholderia silvatlantica]